MLSLISRRDHCQIFSPSQISDTPQARFELAQSPISDFANIRAKFGFSNLPLSPDIRQNSDRVFPISGFLVNPLEKKIVITPEPVIILT